MTNDRPPVVVVFDVNCYVDVAALLTPPFTWDEFDAVASAVRSSPVPHPSDARVDSLRAISFCRPGHLEIGEPLEVWTSEHIDKLVIEKVVERTAPTAKPWSMDQAVDFHDALVNGLVYDITRGGSVGTISIPLGNPPLDHEDGCVLRTANESGEDTLSIRICITRDDGFRNASSIARTRVTPLFPSEFVELVKRKRRPHMPPPRNRS